MRDPVTQTIRLQSDPEPPRRHIGPCDGDKVGAVVVLMKLWLHLIVPSTLLQEGRFLAASVNRR